jgi:hypothetical protein
MASYVSFFMPSGSSKTIAVLRVEYVGDDSVIPKLSCDSGRRRIKEAAGVLCPVRAEAHNLQRASITKCPCNRVSNLDDPDKLTVHFTTDTVFITVDRVMVSMKRVYKRCSRLSADWNHFHSL